MKIIFVTVWCPNGQSYLFAVGHDEVTEILEIENGVCIKRDGTLIQYVYCAYKTISEDEA